MNLIRFAIDNAVAQAIAERPKYFTPNGLRLAQGLIVRKVMAALRDDGTAAVDEGTAMAPTNPGPLKVEIGSREARGYAVLRMVAGAASLPDYGGHVYIPHTACSAAVFALAEVPPRDAWIIIDKREQIGAWLELFRDTLPNGARRAVVINGRMLAPYPFPPSKTGKIYEVETA